MRNKNKTNNTIDVSKLYSLEAEAGAIGSVLIDSTCFGNVMTRLPTADMFFVHEHKLIYDALLKLYIENTPIDAIALRTELKERDMLDEAGGVGYIQKILNSVPHSANAAYYAEIVKSKDKERQLIKAVEEIRKEVLNQTGSVNEKIRNVQNKILTIEPTNTGEGYVEMKKAVEEVAANLEKKKEEAIKTGFYDIDWWLRGYYPGEFVILAGRPSMGKSALAMDMALNMAEQGNTVFFSSLEMTKTSLIERAICSLAGVDIVKLRSGEGDMLEWKQVYESSASLAERNIILSTVTYTPEQFAGMVHSLKRTHDIKIAFIDYLQLMYSYRKKNENRQQEISAISSSLKRTALRENIPIVALSQLNRQVDSREDHRPRMSDLRESGSLEQDADIVQFIYREDYYHKNESDYETTGLAEFITAKNRRGRTGKAELVFLHDYVKFENRAHV